LHARSLAGKKIDQYWTSDSIGICVCIKEQSGIRKTHSIG
jgi:hypothetical protein